MKRVIRENVFESNSSSCHAICVSKDRVDMDKVDVKMIRFTHGEFGWENDEYDGGYCKASYLYQAIWDTTWINYNWDDEEDEKRADAEREQLIKEKCSKIADVLGKYGIMCEFDEEHYNSNGGSEGYIDHGNKLSEWVDKCLNDEEYLLTYLFGDAMVITGNDNDDRFSERMYITDEDDRWSYRLKSEFDGYEVYKKSN